MDKYKDLEIKPFRISDLSRLDVREIEQGRQESMSKMALKLKANPSYSIWHKGKVIFCGGIVLQWHGVGEVWLLCDKSVRRFPKALLVICPEYIAKFIKHYKLHRVQATCQAEWKQSIKLLKKLGFVEEGLMRKFDANQKDYFMMARVL